MQTKIFTIRDFSGGLNTALSPTMLKENESPALSNVDILESKALTRRNGYALVANIVTDTSKGLTRYYRDDGARYWLSANGTALYSRQDAARDAPFGRAEAETVTTATPGFVYAYPAYSGGSGLIVPPGKSQTFNIPYANNLTAKFYAPDTNPAVTASLAIDGATFTNITANALDNASPGYTYTAGVSATTHTVTVKAPDVADWSMDATDWRMTVSGAIKKTGSDPDHYTDGQYVGLAQPNDYAEFKFAGRGVKVYGHKGPSMGYIRISVTHGATGMTITKTVNCYSATTQWKTLLYDTGDQEYGVNTVRVTYSGVRDPASTGYRTEVDRFVCAVGGIVVDYFDHYASGSFSTISTAISSDADRVAFVQSDNAIYYGSASNNLRAFSGASTTATLYACHAWAAGNTYLKGDYVRVGASTWVAATTHVSASWTAEKSADWTASSKSTLAPKADYLALLKTRVFAAHSDSDLIEATALDDTGDWMGGYAAHLVGVNSGHRCTGMTVFQNRIAWFSDSRFHLIDTTGEPAAWVNKTVSQVHGCVAPRSIAEGDNKLVWLAADGVRAYGYIAGVSSDDGSGLMKLSDNIRPTLDAIRDKSLAAGAIYRGRYWLACALEHDYNDTVFVYRFADKGIAGAWVRYDNLFVDGFFVARGDEYALYATDSRSGVLYQLDTGDTDNGAPITMSYTSPPLAVGGYESVKHYPTVHISAASPVAQSITLTPTTGDVDGRTVTVALNASTDVVPVRANISARGRSIQYTITSDGAAQPLTIDAIATSYNQPRLR